MYQALFKSFVYFEDTPFHPKTNHQPVRAHTPLIIIIQQHDSVQGTSCYAHNRITRAIVSSAIAL